MPMLTIQLVQVDEAVRKSFFDELGAAGAQVDAANDSATVTLNSIADCESLSSRLVPVLPPQGRRFKLTTAGPGSTGSLHVFAVPGREVATLAGHMATSAGFQ